MTDTVTPIDSDAALKKAARILSKLSTAVPNVRGALMASPDGRALASVLTEHEPRSTAAIVASSRGLGERLADLAGTGTMEEIIVRSSSGYVVIYAIADKGALTVLAQPSVNLALLHLQARDAIQELVAVVDSIEHSD